jgi:TetR/AcrR family tetracycline transcriptional repressor
MQPERGVERPGVTRDAVVDAALELLAEGGLDAVSFRRIAARLNVSAPTLYWHVAHKRQLMDLMAEALMQRAGSDPVGPEPGQPWWEWLGAHAREMFQALVATRDAPLVLAGNRPTASIFPVIERVLGFLVQGGLSPGEAQQTLFVIGAYVIGSATEWQAEAERSAAEPLPDPADEELSARRAAVLADQPLMQAAIHERLHRPHAETFEFGLDLLVQGMRARFGPRAT